MQDWYDFRSKCPSISDISPDNGYYWIHRQCKEHEKINANGMIQCLKDRRGNKCLNPTFILELSFECNYEGHIDDRKVDGDKVLDAILIGIKVTTMPKKIRKVLADKLIHYDDNDDEG